MFKLIGIAFALTLMCFGAFVPAAMAQGKCWDGTIVNDLKDCPKEPGTKLRSLGQSGAPAAPQGKLSAGEKKSKAGYLYLKSGDVVGE